jgi:spore germination cell wall hydrolase CwlJ-like protein
MPFSRRAAPTAAVVFSALALASLSAPVGAVQVPGQVIQTLNAPETISVPAQQTVEEPLPADASQSEIDTPTIEYATLSAAVAAQDVDVEADRQLKCLATAVYYESKGEPLEGQLAVAHVILNRAASGRFAASVCGVLTQRGQFSFVHGGKIPTPADSAQWRKAVAVAKVAQNELWDNPAPAALYFHARYVHADWGMTKVASLGNHIFYR